MKIKVKPYNSFCVDTLTIGFSSSWSANESEMSLEQRSVMKSFLTHHGLDFPKFEQLIKGVFSPRVHIPFPSQVYRGRILSLKSSPGQDPDLADVIEIEADLGMGVFVIEALRDVCFIFGHWMGKADLRYVLERGMCLCCFYWSGFQLWDARFPCSAYLDFDVFS